MAELTSLKYIEYNKSYQKKQKRLKTIYKR